MIFVVIFKVTKSFYINIMCTLRNCLNSVVTCSIKRCKKRIASTRHIKKEGLHKSSLLKKTGFFYSFQVLHSRVPSLYKTHSLENDLSFNKKKVKT